LLESWRQQRADFAIVERPAEKGDFVKCSYDGLVDDKPIGDLVPDKPIYGKQANTWEEAGAENGVGVPIIIESIVGMKAGDKNSCQTEFPADFEESRLAGKSATYELEVHEVRHKDLPELDDPKFLQAMEVDKVEALRERAETEAKTQKERSNATAKRRQVRDQLLAGVDFELPQADLESETQEIFRAMVDANLRRGAAQEQLESHKDEMFTRAGEDARESIKLRIILSRVAEKEKIEVSREELSQAIATQAMMAGTDPREHFKEMQQDRAKLAHLQQQVLFDKTLALLTEKATVEIKENDEGSEEENEA
jgi:trigger factor